MDPISPIARPQPARCANQDEAAIALLGLDQLKRREEAPDQGSCDRALIGATSDALILEVGTEPGARPDPAQDPRALVARNRVIVCVGEDGALGPVEVATIDQLLVGESELLELAGEQALRRVAQPGVDLGDDLMRFG